MQIPQPHLSSQSRARRPEISSPYQPPLKRRRRRWCDIVDNRALANGTESDAHRIAQRQKQIDYGKNTIAYDRFNARCPRELRVRGDPMTPLPRQKCSKRSFAGQITSWKKQVYAYVAKMDQEQPTNKLDQNPTLATPTDAKQDSDVQTSTLQPSSGTHNDNDDDDDDDFSDMDDIELDDFGNVVSNAPPVPAKDQHNAHAEDADVSPPSIFDDF